MPYTRMVWWLGEGEATRIQRVELGQELSKFFVFRPALQLPNAK